MMPLADYAERYTPTRIYPPGEFVAYSNYGTSLAGYIVESVSGMSFEQYVEENILIPLEMTHSSYRQPLPPALADDLAVGYQYVESAYQPLLEWTQGRPAGGASATAVDMANFMLAHLQDGRFKNSRILQESTAQEMHAQHYNQEPKANGMAYGFMEMEMNGQKIIWHGGATAVFHTAFIL
ncbi:MAG: beta-lactamase family protein, partial [Chloroflexi bacterium]|nr:beta-lactamase family protein [Chloroflexota bacterium]